MIEHKNLMLLKGRSLPSKRFGAWIVDRVSETIDGRSRLISASLRQEKWIWTRDLVGMFKTMDKEQHATDNENKSLR